MPNIVRPCHDVDFRLNFIMLMISSNVLLSLLRLAWVIQMKAKIDIMAEERYRSSTAGRG